MGLGVGAGELGLRDVVELGAVVGLVHERADDVGLLALRHGLGDGGVGHVGVLGRDELGGDARAGMGPLADARAGKVAVDAEGQGARDGRGRHRELVGHAALGAQPRPLVHAEAVLLVHHYERQVMELEVIAQHGRGAEEHAELARGKPGRDGCALVGWRCARHERPADVGGVEERPELLGVLAREDRGGRHDGRLGARVRHGGERHGGHGGLARADVAQKQAVHGPVGRHVVQDLLGGDGLLVRELEGHGVGKGLPVLARGEVPVRVRPGKLYLAAREKGHLQAEQLVVGKAPAGALGGGLACGKVRLANGAGLGHEAVSGHEGGRHEVAGVAPVGHGGARDAAHPGGAQALAHAVDGKQPRKSGRSGLLALVGHDLVELRRHLLEAVGEGHLARDGQGVAFLELLGQPRLLEEGAHEHARVVEQGHLDDGQLGARALELDLVDHAQHGALAAHVGARYLGDAREVEVAARHVEQGVSHGGDAHAAQGLGLGAASKTQA